MLISETESNNSNISTYFQTEYTTQPNIAQQLHLSTEKSRSYTEILFLSQVNLNKRLVKWIGQMRLWLCQNMHLWKVPKMRVKFRNQRNRFINWGFYKPICFWYDYFIRTSFWWFQQIRPRFLTIPGILFQIRLHVFRIHKLSISSK